jgi:hypothetical protein
MYRHKFEYNTLPIIADPYEQKRKGKKNNNSIKHHSDHLIFTYAHTHFVLGTHLYITSIDYITKGTYTYIKHHERM